MENPTADTKTNILDVAERLFAEKGIDSTSTRAIVSEAGVNLAAINYHFGSKEGLLMAVMHRIISKINDERVRQLDALESQDGQADIEDIVYAFLSPVAMTMNQQPERIKYFFKLFSQIHSDPNKFEQIASELFAEVGLRFKKAIQRTVPHLSHQEVMWRFKFMLGAIQMCVVPLPLSRKTQKEPQIKDIDQVIAFIVQFVAAGFKAPAIENSTSKKVNVAKGKITP